MKCKNCKGVRVTRVMAAQRGPWRSHILWICRRCGSLVRKEKIKTQDPALTSYAAMP